MKLFQFTYQSVIGDLNGEPERLHVALRELVDRAQKRAKAVVGEVHIDMAPLADSDESAARELTEEAEAELQAAETHDLSGCNANAD